MLVPPTIMYPNKSQPFTICSKLVYVNSKQSRKGQKDIEEEGLLGEKGQQGVAKAQAQFLYPQQQLNTMVLKLHVQYAFLTLLNMNGVFVSRATMYYMKRAGEIIWTNDKQIHGWNAHVVVALDT